MVPLGVAVTGDPFALLKLPEGLHVYVLAPVAVRVDVNPLQRVDEEAVKVSVGNEFTFIVTVWLLVQPAAFVPFTVYVVGTIGVAATTEPVVVFNPVGGVQV